MKLAHDIHPELDKYELISVLGHGGMATVYHARDRRLGRDVAVKVIHRHLRDDQEIATRFVREARAQVRLRHPNVAQIYFIGEDRGFHFRHRDSQATVAGAAGLFKHNGANAWQGLPVVL